MVTSFEAPAGRGPTASRRAALFVAILLLALLVRVWGVQTQSLTMDELADTRNAKQSIASILQTQDGFPPLYGVLFRGWYAAFPTDQAARWPSVIFGLLAIPAMWRLGARVAGERTGLAAALVLAVSPFHVAFSQEARAYALYLLFAVLALWLFFRAMATNRLADWIFYTLACAGGLYAHYYFVLFPLTAGLLLLLEKRPRELGPGVIAHVAIGLVGLSLLPFLQADLAYQAGYPHQAPFNVVVLGYTYFSFVTGFTIGPSLRELHELPTGAALRMVLPWVLAVGATSLVLAALAWKALRLAPGTRATAVRLAVLTTLPVIVGGVLAEVFGVGFRVRYLAWVAIPVLVILAVGIASTQLRWPRNVATLALMAVSAIALANRRFVPRYWNEDTGALAQFLRTSSHPSVPVFVISDYMADPVEYYLGESWRVCALPNVPAPTSDVSAPLRVIYTLTPADSSFWFVYSRPFHGDPLGRARQALLDAGLIRPRAEFAGILLYEGHARARPHSVQPRTCEAYAGERAPAVAP